MADISAGVLCGALCQPDQVGGLGVLQADDLVASYQLGGDAVLEASPGVPAFLLYSAELRLGAEVALGGFAYPAEAALGGAVLSLLGDEAGAAVIQGGVALTLGLALEPSGGLAMLAVVDAGDGGDVALVVDGGDEALDTGVDADGQSGCFAEGQGGPF